MLRMFFSESVYHILLSSDQKVSNVFSISEVTRLLKNKDAAFLIIVKVVVGK